MFVSMKLRNSVGIHIFISSLGESPRDILKTSIPSIYVSLFTIFISYASSIQCLHGFFNISTGECLWKITAIFNIILNAICWLTHYIKIHFFSLCALTVLRSLILSRMAIRSAVISLLLRGISEMIFA
jgi:hypothetical protein